MKKRLLAVLLSCVMTLSLLPVSAFASTGVNGMTSDADVIPDDYVPIYTMSDLKKCHGSYYLLMNDIDASKEDIAYDGNGYNAHSFAGRLFSGGVLNGNGHTIYNMRGTLFEYNMGTICNLNVSLNNTDEDTDTFMAGNGLAGIALSNANGANEGIIENCTVTMNVTRSFKKLAGYLNIDGISSGGTIRNCIANLNIYLDARSPLDNSHSISVSGIGSGNNNSLVDHCLVLGSITILGSGLGSGRQNVHFNGISACTAQDSAFALNSLLVTAEESREDPYEYFTLSSGDTSLAGTDSIRNRVASDLTVNYEYNKQTILSGKPTSQAGTFIQDTRANILKDWNISNVPAETPPTDIPVHTPDLEPTPTTPTETTDFADSFPEGDVWFRYSASGGGVKQHSFHYDSDYFNKNGAFQMPLAVASLCLELSAWSDNLNLAWDSTQNNITPARATNILELYGKLGFTNAKCVNYDVPLTDTSDKVAFSMAMKYIDNGKGGTDTLVAVPIRGGGYGGEWGSNFHVTYDWTYSQYVNHLGFESAAKKAKTAVQEYLDSHDIKGDVKIWLVGYSRGAAVANILGHYLAEDATPGGINIQRKNLYAYTFATPAGVSEAYMDDSDTNIFNFVSPVDIVPMVAPAQWGFGRYGQTIQLTPNFSHEALEKFRLLSGYTDVDSKLTIGSSHQAEINLLMDWLCGLVPDAGNFYQSGLQTTLVNGIGQLEGRDPVEKAEEKVAQQTAKQLEQVASYAIKAVQAVKNPEGVLISSGVKWTVKDFLSKRIKNVGLAHCPELYLTWLEMNNSKMLNSLEKAAEKKQLIIQEPYVNVRFWNKSSGASAGSYVSGVCSSGEVEVEKTDLGLVATFPAGNDYTFTVSGTDASNSVSFTVFTYDNDSIGQFAATSQFTDLPLDGGRSYTITVDEDPYEEPYAVDQNGKYYVPDDGTPRVNFTDVPDTAYFHDAVEWAVEEGITSGTTATTFSPYNACTRAQVVTFLWRAAGCPEPESSYDPFVDVPVSAYYHDAVLWAAEEGITTGVTATRFNPNATVTRGQTVTFLWRWDGEPDADSTNSFRDVAAGDYYSNAVSWAVEAGITKGTTATAFSPNQTCTRAQIVTFLYRDLYDFD